MKGLQYADTWNYFLCTTELHPRSYIFVKEKNLTNMGDAFEK